MLRKNYSGQFLYFGLASVASGLPITGAAAGISGRRSIDGGAQSLVSGTVTVVGGGQYVCNLFAPDTNGNNIGFLFTASGAAMVSFSVVTDGLSSGNVFAASGGNATVPPASLSGLVVNSGLFVTVPPASLSGVVANSGLFVNSLPASGQVYLASGLPALNPSGAVTVATNLDKSGYTGTVVSGTTYVNSGASVSLLSGNFVQLYSGQQTLAASGAAGREVLTMNWSGLAAVSGQPNLLNAARKLMNRFGFAASGASSGYLTVYEEDGVTVAYRQAVTAVAGAKSVTSLDTA